MNRKQRPASARATNWVRTFDGTNIIRGYRKKFGVDILCAITELRSLGVKIDPEYEAKVRQSIEGAARAKQKKTERDEWSDSDDTFAFIAGYTPGGVPYGLTWDEVEEDPLWAEDELDDRIK